MDFTGVPDSTVGAITDVDITDEGFIGDPALNGNASSKGTKDSSTAAFETAVAALKDTRDSSTVAFEMAIVAFTAGGGSCGGRVILERTAANNRDKKHIANTSAEANPRTLFFGLSSSRIVFSI